MGARYSSVRPECRSIGKKRIRNKSDRAVSKFGQYESSYASCQRSKNQKLYLTYKYWHDIEEDFDYGFVYVQPEGKDEWIPAAEYSGRTSEWKDGQIDLSEYGGQTIKIMFNLQSDDSIEGDGLYIDDVALVKEVKSAGTKKRLGVEKQPAKMKDKKTKKQTIDPKKQNRQKPFKNILRRKKQLLQFFRCGLRSACWRRANRHIPTKQQAHTVWLMHLERIR